MNLIFFTVCNQAESWWTVKQSAVHNYYAYQLCSILTQQKKLIMWFITYKITTKRQTLCSKFFHLVPSFSDFSCAKWQYKDQGEKKYNLSYSDLTSFCFQYQSKTSDWSNRTYVLDKYKKTATVNTHHQTAVKGMWPADGYLL